MPQPKTKPASTTRKRPAAKAPEPTPREQLLRLLNPLDSVLLTRERLQEVVDDAVERGRMTRSDATELVTQIFSLGKRTTEDVLGDIDQLLGGPADRVPREARRAPAPRVRAEAARPPRATGLGPSFPILGYDDLTGAQVQARLEDLTPAQ